MITDSVGSVIVALPLILDNHINVYLLKFSFSYIFLHNLAQL